MDMMAPSSEERDLNDTIAGVGVPTHDVKRARECGPPIGWGALSIPEFIERKTDMKTTIIAIIAAAGVANAGLVDVDISGITTNDAEGAATNTVITVDLGSATTVTSIGWDVLQTAGLDSGGASWLSEMTIAIDWEQDGINDLFITPSATGAPGTEANSSGGQILLADAGLPDGVVGTGLFNIEFFESFVDEDGAAEGIFNSGSTLSFGLIPAPGAGALLGLGGLVAARRRR